MAPSGGGDHPVADALGQFGESAYSQPHQRLCEVTESVMYWPVKSDLGRVGAHPLCSCMGTLPTGHTQHQMQTFSGLLKFLLEKFSLKSEVLTFGDPAQIFFFFSDEGQKGRDEKVRVIGLSPHSCFESRASGETNEEDACLEQALTLT